MANTPHNVYLFVHAIWATGERTKLLRKPIRTLFFPAIRKMAGDKGIKIIALNGVEDHLHCVFHLLPAQNLLQVVHSVKQDSANWLNETRLIPEPFFWETGYSAYTVSPGGLKQVTDYLLKQEEYHSSRTLENELEIFEKSKPEY